MHDVLVIDDDARVRELLIDILRDEGYRVRSAVSATAGLREIERDAPACLLLDLHLPDMTGDDLLRLLRTNGYTFSVCLITASPEKAAALPDMRDVMCFAKPFNIELLLAYVAQSV